MGEELVKKSGTGDDAFGAPFDRINVCGFVE
jgi:hypothetical protein